MNGATDALLISIKHAPLLGSDLPEAACFDRSLFGEIPTAQSLNVDQKLGRLYEQALKLVLEASPRIELLGSHIQVFDDLRCTIGEFDFLLRDLRQDQIIHLELATKFYLAVKHEGKWLFPGPNGRDHWHRKLNRLQNHQFRLSQEAHGKRLLRAQFGDKNIQVQQLIYGCSFTPIDTPTHQSAMGMAATRRKGRWLYPDQWAQHFAGVTQILMVPKHLWPVPITAEIEPLLQPLTPKQLIEKSQENSTLFTISNRSDVWFMVPPNWPTGGTG